MKRKQLNTKTIRFAGDESYPKQPAFFMPQDSTSGQVGPGFANNKFRQCSEQALPSDRLQCDEKLSPDNNEAIPPNNTTARDGKRFEKAKVQAEKTGVKLDAAHEKMVAQRPPPKPGPVKTAGRAARLQAWRYVHGKIHEVEHENVSVEASHRAELTGEAAIRGTARFAKHRTRTRQVRRVRKWERRDVRAKADLQYRKMVREYPELRGNALSRLLQKQRIKRRYQKQAREAAKKGAKAAKKTAVTMEKIIGAIVGFIKRHPVGVLIALGVLLLIISLQSCMASMVSIGNGLAGAVGAATYPSEDADMLAAEAAYAGLETKLQDELDNYETLYPDYDEYHYELDDIEHDPYALVSILSALHEGTWMLNEVQDDLTMLFERQYILTETVDVEVRYRQETRTGSYTYTDPETGETVTEEYEYEVTVAYNYYICTVQLTNFNLSHRPSIS